jgi:hypothetical protein
MAASVAASHVKRILDAGFYEQLEERFGKHLRHFSPKRRKAIEAILYFINAFVDKHMPENGALEKFIKDVATDAPPELGVRLVNGRYRSRRGQELDLSDLTEEELTAFLNWYEHASAADRKVFVDFTKRLTIQQLSQYMRISPQLRERLLNYTIEQERKPVRKPLISEHIGFLDRLTARMRGERRVTCTP